MRTFLFRVSTVVVLTIGIASAQARQSTYDPGIRPVTPATTAAEHAAEDDWLAHLQFLASDALKGRLTGTPEFLRAVEYVEAQFKAIGLKPAGIEGHGPLKAYFRTPAERWKELKVAGAIGVVTIQPVAGRSAFSARPVTLLSDPVTDALAGLRLSATLFGKAAETLFEGSQHTLAELQTIAQAGQPFPHFALAVNVQATTSVKVLEEFNAPNVVGVLPGSDPRLKSEYLILSAHLDHVGVGKEVNGDAIYNGAMDNAVGIASLIEVAKSLAALHPRRSIIFLALTGEEEGELGSQYFARFTTVPRSNIVADLNMDMYLPLFPLRFLEVQGLGESTLGDDARAAAQKNDIEVQFDKQPDENRFIRSDQASFVKYGIPGLAFKFGWLPGSSEEALFNEWIKNRYHRPSDDLLQPIDKAAVSVRS